MPSDQEFENLAREVRRLANFIDKAFDDAVALQVRQKVSAVSSEVDILRGDFEKHVKGYDKDMAAIKKKIK